MKAYSQGILTPEITAIGNPGYPAYLVRGKEKNMMIDAGLNLMGPLYLRSLEEILGGSEGLHYLLATHSHYDHIGSMPYLKRMIPDLKLGGHPRIPELLSRPSVLATMNRLGAMQSEIFKDITGEEDVSLEPVDFELNLTEGDTLDLGGLTCHVMETPGHTRDCLSYWFPEIKALVPGEIIGVPDWNEGKEVAVEFLSSYDDYLESIERLIKLKPEFIAMAHGWYFTGTDATNYLLDSLKATAEHRIFLEEHIARSGFSIEQAIETIAREEYDEKGTIFQERNAYMANLTAQVKHIASIMDVPAGAGEKK